MPQEYLEASNQKENPSPQEKTEVLGVGRLLSATQLRFTAITPTGLRAWEDEEELAKELRWLDSGDIDKEYKEKYWDACKDKEFYREKAKAIFGRGNFARPVVSVEQIATILTKCKSIFKNPHHYSMDEQGKMVMDDARLIHDLHNRSGWHIRRCEICGLVYQYDTSD